MIRGVVAVLAFAIGVAAARPDPALASGVTAVSGAVVAAAVQADAQAGAAQPEQPAAGLPQREPPPRTLAAFWPVYVGFVVALFAIVGYIVRGVGSKSARVARAIDELGTPGAG